MADIVPYVVGCLILAGAFFVLVAAIGVLRLDDLYMRMHAAAKAGTLGISLLLLALAIESQTVAVVTRAIACIVFFFLTAPVAAHLLARAAYVVGYRPCPLTKHDALSGVIVPPGSSADSTIADSDADMGA